MSENVTDADRVEARAFRQNMRCPHGAAACHWCSDCIAALIARVRAEERATVKREIHQRIRATMRNLEHETGDRPIGEAAAGPTEGQT